VVPIEVVVPTELTNQQEFIEQIVSGIEKNSVMGTAV
jgi:hypothetical protein